MRESARKDPDAPHHCGHNQNAQPPHVPREGPRRRLPADVRGYRAHRGQRRRGPGAREQGDRRPAAGGARQDRADRQRDLVGARGRRQPRLREGARTRVPVRRRPRRRRHLGPRLPREGLRAAGRAPRGGGGRRRGRSRPRADRGGLHRRGLPRAPGLASAAGRVQRAARAQLHPDRLPPVPHVRPRRAGRMAKRPARPRRLGLQPPPVHARTDRLRRRAPGPVAPPDHDGPGPRELVRRGLRRPSPVRRSHPRRVPAPRSRAVRRPRARRAGGGRGVLPRRAAPVRRVRGQTERGRRIRPRRPEQAPGSRQVGAVLGPGPREGVQRSPARRHH